jgi:hypothetical protein
MRRRRRARTHTNHIIIKQKHNVKQNKAKRLRSTILENSLLSLNITYSRTTKFLHHQPINVGAQAFLMDYIIRRTG